MCKDCREKGLMTNCSVCIVGKKMMEARLLATVNLNKKNNIK